MIWKRALPGPRVITITHSNSRPQTFAQSLERQPNPPKCIAVPPTLLLVNSESRQIALKIYKLAFQCRLLKPIYIDFACDTLFFTDFSALKAVTLPIDSTNSATNRGENASVRYLFLGSEPHRSYELVTAKLLAVFRRVETIAISTDDNSSKWQMSPEKYKKSFDEVWTKYTFLGRSAETALAISYMKHDEMVETARRSASGF